MHTNREWRPDTYSSEIGCYEPTVWVTRNSSFLPVIPDSLSHRIHATVTVSNTFRALASRGHFLQGIRPRLGQREAQTKSRTLSQHRFEINRSVVPLQNLVGLRQPDSGPFFLGGEIK